MHMFLDWIWKLVKKCYSINAITSGLKIKDISLKSKEDCLSESSSDDDKGITFFYKEIQ